ncbi:hypothetical protein DBR11_00080 [Pedobacter sp. HMWF019]|uniref:hypothetical protein n=1 Tax=Pedobacter sp. HMWF019 TaxID=2056856 RepID=UPI000D3D918E|nr:hypothetical protein [Pedobacter sp. HMWF019]PTT04250.1 hypothetical protein DBR11_00080 [Pedobacter sp. HMWF019]
MIDVEIFKSERYFTVFGALVSHGQLLLRSQKNNVDTNNIDIIFYGTVYIQLFSRLTGISIKRVRTDTKSLGYNTANEYLSHNGNCLFEIKSNGELYYIAASFVKVFENTLEFYETSLNAENKGMEREIASSVIK